MSKPTLYLRIASLLTLMMATLHTIGGVFGAPSPGAGAVAWTAMQTNHFVVFGMDRTYERFYIGFGLSITVCLVMEAIVFWLLGNLARKGTANLRPILAVFFAGYLVSAALAYLFFFPPPVVTYFLISVCLGLALFTAKPVPSA